MVTNIDDLLKNSKQDSQDPETETNAADLAAPTLSAHRPEVASQEKSAELQAKMNELQRRDLELETLARARNLNLGYLSLQGVSIDPDVLQIVSEHEAFTKKVICFYYVPYQELRLGAVAPSGAEVQEIKQRLGERHHTPVKLYLISQASFEEGLKQYQKLPHIRPAVERIEITDSDLAKFVNVVTVDKLSQQLRQVTMSELLSLVVASALQLNASDVHIESEEKATNIRYRIDGMMQDVAALGVEYYRPIASRIKLLAKLKINVTNRPQDGHFVITRPGGRIDVRVSTLPTNYGESLVLRVLRSDIARLKISDLGLSQGNHEILTKEIQKPNGLLVVTGPTGSGKTTSLYAILGELNSKEIKILTIEDPIEYELSGINQSQVNQDAGYTFAAGLRSLVRQDPDVILVGEMRDQETVEIGVNAALTGHLVLSTMHTNDAAGAIPRFLAMGAKPYLLSPALNAVVAQRLVRVLCPDCRVGTTLTSETQERVDKILTDLPPKVVEKLPEQRQFYTGTGCQACHGLKFKGRIGVFEIFVMTPELEDLVLKGATSSIAIRQQLTNQGMVTMIQDGLIKALQGVTSAEEVFRVIQEE